MKVALLLLAGLACVGAASLPALALRPPSPSHQLAPGAGPVKQLRPAPRPAHRTARLSGQAAPRTILDTILSILHSLGVTDEEIAAALEELQHQMEIVIADMTPEEILEVQHALDDILNQVNSGEADISQVLVDLTIIYTDVYPHLTPEGQAALDQIVQIIFDIIAGAAGGKEAQPKTILDTLLAILHALGFTDEDIAHALEELQHQMEIVIADMTPEEILEVQHALDDILNQVNSGEADINQVLVDLSIIYTDVYPHLTPEAQAALDQIVQIIFDIIAGAAGGKEAQPKTILDIISGGLGSKIRH